MDFYIGQSAEFSKTISEADVYNYAGVVGDFNPIHTNMVYAQNSMFGNRVVHGTLVLGLISTVLGMYLPGAGTIYLCQESTFCKPVFIGDTITAQAVIQAIDSKGRATLETRCINQHGEIVVEGKSIVKLPG
ncbi:MAG: MaoC family dehydratase [Roseburia sp.]|nr:MaoC family dehydratase [Roseburia sp.]